MRQPNSDLQQARIDNTFRHLSIDSRAEKWVKKKIRYRVECDPLTMGMVLWDETRVAT